MVLFICADLLTQYRVDLEGSQVVVDIEERKGNWTPVERKIIVEVIGKGEQEFIDNGKSKRLVFQ